MNDDMNDDMNDTNHNRDIRNKPDKNLLLEPHQGILLIAHGSILADAEGDVRLLAEGLREHTDARVVEVGFLDYTDPRIPQAVAACVKQGVNELLVLPYFLTTGFLLTKCLTRVKEAAAKHPTLTLRLAPPLGPHEKLADIVVERVEEASENLEK
ncbi:MAG TPA: CbiX/SirB N-terminal domain-containing protein [Bacilli bacterium]|nr:CbiX/SirB N-terminal domain-containing protein [Bacilli bacterium]